METITLPQQCKDIPELPILNFLERLGDRWGTLYKGGTDTSLFENSIWHALPPQTPPKLVVAKVRGLIQRGLITGCTCGCRGDLELTAKGKEYLATVAQ